MKTLDLLLGAAVYCADQKFGRLSKVVIAPARGLVTDLVVESGGLLTKRARRLPLAAVEETADGRVYLALSADVVDDYPEYAEMELVDAAEGSALAVTPQALLSLATFHDVAPATRPVVTQSQKVREGIPAEYIVLERGVPIHYQATLAGHLEGVQTSDGQLTHLVMEPAAAVTHQQVIPMALVETLGETHITIATDKVEPAELPPYVPQEVLPNSEQLLGPEAAVAARITAALAADPRTRSGVVDVISDRGIVTLTGQVDSLTTRKIVEAITAVQPGVITVINNLKVQQSY
ncbi:MAG: BON domain-containing protein [Chloroflexota bacterium]